MMKAAIVIVTWLRLVPWVVSFHHSSTRTTTSTTTTTLRLQLQRSNQRPSNLVQLQLSSNNNQGRPRNEFCRSVPPDKIMKLAGRATVDQQQYSVEIAASLDECDALAERFQLPKISSLGATLALAPEGRNAVRGTRGIIVEGTGHATVTRICVRTNEQFETNLEFDIDCVVRPVDGLGAFLSSSSSYTETGNSQVVQLTRDSRKSKKTPKKRKNKGDIYFEEEDITDDIDPKDLQKVESMLNKLDSNDAKLEDILMEDDSIYATNGMFDIGELVAQLFWLDLDPYPRKPGSEFIQFSITG